MDDEFLHYLIDKSKTLIVGPDEIITYFGSINREMYFICKGLCLKQTEIIFLHIPENNTYETIGPGSSIGFSSLLFGLPSLNNVCTLTHCVLIHINVQTFNAALQQAPLLYRTVYRTRQLILAKYQSNYEVKMIENPHYTKRKRRLKLKYKKLNHRLIENEYLFAPYMPRLYYLRFILDILVYTDIYWRFHVAFYGDKNQLIIHPWTTAENYLKGQFLFDVLIWFPYPVIMTMFFNHTEGHSEFAHSLSPHFFHCGLHLIKILDIYRVFSMMVHFNERLNTYSAYRCFKYFFFTIVLVHSWGMILVITTCKYLHHNDVARFAEGNVTKIPGMIIVPKAELNLYCYEHSWLNRLVAFIYLYRVIITVGDRWRCAVLSIYSLLSQMNSTLHEDVVLYLYEATLRHVPMFENADHSFFRVIAKELREEYFIEGDTVVRNNDIVQDIYIIHKGSVELSNAHNMIPVIMGIGGVFGNVFEKDKSLCGISVRALKNLDLLCLNVETFRKLLKDYPFIQKKLSLSTKNEKQKHYAIPSSFLEDGNVYLSPNMYWNTKQQLTNKKKSFFSSCKSNFNYDTHRITAFSCFILFTTYWNFILTTYQFCFQQYCHILLTTAVIIDVIFLLKFCMEINAPSMTPSTFSTNKTFLAKYDDYYLYYINFKIYHLCLFVFLDVCKGGGEEL
ncbi:voltage and ligand gated potassium channel [Holotrichia oblita]|uniref:Voltage and ligand gated potassium channel n=1 Tax=Holotrichia oblita TaxID=644536 RepID=A0ACB9SVQ8_HOLOL|nr:voltage and ligand gated potassium channel [Holotrichia oblita]